MEDWLIYGVMAAILIVCVCYSQLKDSKNKKLAANGEDMNRLKDIVARALPGETGYTVAYAHHEDVQSYGRSTRTTYYTYALAFDTSRLWVIPLGYKKNDVLAGQPYLASANMGKVTVTPREKNGVLKSVAVNYLNKDGEMPTQMEVDALNTRKDKFHHFNILQQDECEQFLTLMNNLSDKAKQENPDLDALLDEKANAQNAKTARTLGILGIAFCWCFGFVGLIFGIIGLICAPKPSQTGGKATAPFVLSMIATILNAVLSVSFVLAVIML